ncbi:MAG: transcriptional regulator [Chloroflexi bacterium]|nr:MAG: transcriptional regulator [Chloroflexota bacterium]
MAQFDELIHQPVRLRIMAALMTLDSDTRISFNALKAVLKVTDGNLGGHLFKLEKARYVLVEKTLVHNKPQTFIALTAHGRMAFAEHIAALQQILQPSVPLTPVAPPATEEVRPPVTP